MTTILEKTQERKSSSSPHECKLKHLLVAGIALFALFQFASGFLTDDRFGCDQRLRHNEICCAHHGVNSFRIWNHETTLQGFCPYPSDKPSLPHAETDVPVHAYPPWHTAMFYFLGWMSGSACVGLMTIVFLLSLCFIAHECVRLSKARFERYGLVSAVALSLIMFNAGNCLGMLNYGVLVLAAFLLMNKALEKDRELLAGTAWAIMMIKPQVGLLFFWPLFWHRRYRTIATAVAICLAATFATSRIVHESVIDLILQIPQIGRPYGSGTIVNKILSPLFGKNVMFVIMVFFFVLTGGVTWLMRRNRDFLVACVPVVLSIPLWTYSQAHDHVILLPLFIFMSALAFSSRRGMGRGMRIVLAWYCMMVLFTDSWSLCMGLKLFDPTGIGWIYRLVSMASQTLLIASAVLILDAVKENSRRECAGDRAQPRRDRASRDGVCDRRMMRRNMV